MTTIFRQSANGCPAILNLTQQFSIWPERLKMVRPPGGQLSIAQPFPAVRSLCRQIQALAKLSPQGRVGRTA